MEVAVRVDGAHAELLMAGKLNVHSSAGLEEAVAGLPGGVCDIDIDLSGTEYVSSAGLRVLVATARLAMRRGGVMRLLHPTDDVMEVFEMTGLTDILVVER